MDLWYEEHRKETWKWKRRETRDKNAKRMRKSAFRALTSGSNGSCEQCAFRSLQDFLKVIDTFKTFQDDQVMVWKAWAVGAGMTSGDTIQLTLRWSFTFAFHFSVSFFQCSFHCSVFSFTFFLFFFHFSIWLFHFCLLISLFHIRIFTFTWSPTNRAYKNIVFFYTMETIQKTYFCTQSQIVNPIRLLLLTQKNVFFPFNNAIISNLSYTHVILEECSVLKY